MWSRIRCATDGWRLSALCAVLGSSWSPGCGDCRIGHFASEHTVLTCTCGCDSQRSLYAPYLGFAPGGVVQFREAIEAPEFSDMIISDQFDFPNLGGRSISGNFWLRLPLASEEVALGSADSSSTFYLNYEIDDGPTLHSGRVRRVGDGMLELRIELEPPGEPAIVITSLYYEAGGSLTCDSDTSVPRKIPPSPACPL